MLEPGAEIVYAWPSFSMYPHLAAASGARAITVPLDDEGRHDLEAMAARGHRATRIVLVCNPNNPTATALPLDAIDAFVAELPRHVAVILDEAYVEFSTLQDPDESLDLLRAAPEPGAAAHLLQGLRAVRAARRATRSARRSSALAVDRVRQPFSVNALAQAAAAEALRHQDEVERRVERTASSACTWSPGSRSAASRRTDSQANFSWVSLGDRDEAEVVRGLAERGVIVRAGTALGGEGALRVTYGTPARERPLPGGAGRGAGQARSQAGAQLAGASWRCCAATRPDPLPRSSRRTRW